MAPWTAALQAPLSFTISQSLLRPMSIASVMLSNHLILCHPVFLLPFLISQMVKSLLQCRRPGINPWVRKIPWSRKWQPTPVFLPGESHGQRSLAGYRPWDHKESDMTERHFICDFLIILYFAYAYIFSSYFQIFKHIV